MVKTANDEIIKFNNIEKISFIQAYLLFMGKIKVKHIDN